MRTLRRTFWGLFFIIAAVLIVLNTFGALPTISLFTLVCTIFLIAIMLESITHMDFFGILFSIAFLGILYAVPLGITALTPWPILAVALLVSIGLSIIFGCHRHHWYYHYDCNSNCDNNCHCDSMGYNKETTSATNDGDVNIRVNMNGSVKYISTDNFKVANIDCSFSGLKVYFDQAKIQGDSAVININCSFSGLELYIPREWKIINNMDSILGGIEEKNRMHIGKSDATNEKRITLNGTSKLSGIEIIYI